MFFSKDGTPPPTPSGPPEKSAEQINEAIAAERGRMEADIDAAHKKLAAFQEAVIRARECEAELYAALFSKAVGLHGDYHYTVLQDEAKRASNRAATAVLRFAESNRYQVRAEFASQGGTYLGPETVPYLRPYAPAREVAASA